MGNKMTDFRIMIRKLMLEKDISIAKLARHPDVDLNCGTLYNYLDSNGSDMKGENIAKVLDCLRSL
jgi:predicted transcriptional regulator